MNNAQLVLSCQEIIFLLFSSNFNSVFISKVYEIGISLLNDFTFRRFLRALNLLTFPIISDEQLSIFFRQKFLVLVVINKVTTTHIIIKKPKKARRFFAIFQLFNLHLEEHLCFAFDNIFV